MGTYIRLWFSQIANVYLNFGDLKHHRLYCIISCLILCYIADDFRGKCAFCAFSKNRVGPGEEAYDLPIQEITRRVRIRPRTLNPKPWSSDPGDHQEGAYQALNPQI